MKTRAAVAFAAKTLLEIVDFELDGPRAGEVLIEIIATGIVREVGEGMTSVAVGDHVSSFYTPECRSPPQSAWRFVTTSLALNPMVCP